MSDDPQVGAMTGERFRTLDTVRGVAVMGILLMNIVGFAMPEAAYINPRAWGGSGPVDAGAWAMMFVLVDSKMRGLFSMLFGASMLLVYTRAEAAAGNGRAVHLRRMGWLLIFGLVHFYLIWSGDILILYALCGMVGTLLLNRDESELKRWALWLIGLGFAMLTVMMMGMFLLQFAAHLPRPDPDITKAYADMVGGMGEGSNRAHELAEVALHRGGWWGIVHDKLTEGLFDPLIAVATSGLETLGLMTLGMLMLRNGFLTGAWEPARYVQAMRWCYAIGLPPLIAMAAWAWGSGFDPVVTLANFVAWSMPFRILVTIGHAALIVLLVRRCATSAIVARIEAAGRMAFSNYLGTSILMTTLFYGYGAGLYGQLSRWQVYLIAPLVWAIILLWSKPWLDRFRYGPLEWLWRSLARGQLQPMRR